ncbi:helicase C-terminal domain-containing protein [Paraphoma chrysanthemicola]|uniref:ATP-dependent DNA helicase CHL1 n=1 Tax=Paraphoma chrysanthemicola TaxID=798071 RepID=A0A8K0R254_9PLEO|nr:helicase C-terminal domain-containing protein [Paraphoma chrysanthemicola]
MDGNGKLRDFHHPYQPYDIQQDFMNALYDCLESGKVGIFESPTGTGKSLSIICGALTWLRDHQRRTFEDGISTATDASDEPSWILEHAQQQRRLEALARKRELDDRLAKVKETERQRNERYANSEPRFKKQKLAPSGSTADRDDAEFMLEDYDSDNDGQTATEGTAYHKSGLTPQTQTLMEQLGYSVGDSKLNNEKAEDETKIFFCSRTHSQLSQFSGELHRVQLPPALTPECYSDSPDADLVENVKHLTLGSRRNLCINDKVNHLRSATAINERCIELQRTTSSGNHCPHMPTKTSEGLLVEFRDHALARIRDIEDLGKLGKRLGICPYYASRPVVQHCEKSSRESLGLSLKNHVVIIDEAHNLMDAIAGIYSICVTLEQIQQARLQLTVYLQKFRNKLKGKNRTYIAQVMRILDAMIAYLSGINATTRATSGVVDMLSVMSGKGLDGINVFKLNAYLQESRLARKVDGYTAYSDARTNAHTGVSPNGFSAREPRHNVPVLMHLQAFLLSLTNPSSEGRFFYSKEDNPSTSLKYMLLDPTFHFRDIVEDARAVVLAGGTMSPMSDYEQHLLSYLEPSKITTLSCGHVIPPSNLLAMPVATSRLGTELNFTFEHRNDENTLINLGDTLLLMAQNIPDGVVVFFPSYIYLETCIAAWKRLHVSTSGATFWDRLEQVKPIFWEQRNQQRESVLPNSSQDDAAGSVLTGYSAACAANKGRGALLFAVIGGSLSEGINFSDALGRGVIVVGLPFPNAHSAEWKAKLGYISTKAKQNGGDGQAAARDFLENTCMRAVNQCIGRAIRHKGDYAAIFMLDRRYGTQRIKDKLPGWIRGSLHGECSLKDVVHKLQVFFSDGMEERGAYTSVAQVEEQSADLTAHDKEAACKAHDPEIAAGWEIGIEDCSTPGSEDLLHLTRVADKLPYGAFLVAVVELCERFAYYGLSGPFQNYIANSYKDPNGLPGALGLKQSGATAMTNLFQFWCYVTPVFGAIVADQYLGKYATIKWFSVVYMVGISILFATSLPWSIEQGAAGPGLVVAMVVIGLGTGGIKSNVSPLIAEQVLSTKPYIKTLHSGEKVIVDPEITVQRIYMIFYLCINLGSISAIATTMLELHVGFWSAYLLPLVMFGVGFGVLVKGKNNYVIKPPQGGVIGDCFRALYIAMRNGLDLEQAKPTSGKRGIGKQLISWEDGFVDELRTALVACKVFLFFPIYWVAFSQMMNNFVSQAGQMQLHGLPNDILPNIDPITIIIMIPLMDRIVYPCIRTKLHLTFAPVTRITLGFLVAGLAMLYAGILQTIIYHAPPPNEVHVAYQAPAYVLVAMSEILASITGLELAYAKAPRNMKSFIMSLFLLTSAGGSALGILIAPFAKDPYLQWLYFGLATLAIVTAWVFWRTFRTVVEPSNEMFGGAGDYELTRVRQDNDNYGCSSSGGVDRGHRDV